MIDNLEKKLIEDYWIEKLKEANIINSDFRKIESTSEISIDVCNLNYFSKLTYGNDIAEYTVLLTIYDALLQRYFNDCTLIFSLNSLQYKDVKNGTPLIYSIKSDTKLTLMESLQVVKDEVQQVYGYSKYDLSSLNKRIGNQTFKSATPFGMIYDFNVNTESSGSLFLLKICKQDKGNLNISIDFSEDYIKRSVVNHFLNNFKKWLENLKSYLNTSVFEIPLLSDKEKEHLIYKFNNTKKEYPSDKTIVDLFEEQVNKTPDNIAIAFESSSLTYKELNKKSNQLAHYLTNKYEIKADDIIGVLLPKSDQSIITILAILKTGAAYLPIDTNYPKPRIDYIIEDSKLKFLISSKEFIGLVSSQESINLDQIDLKKERDGNLNKNISPQDLAYVIYTSGSTGQPKGVMIEHTSNVNMSLDQILVFNITEKDKVVWFASVAFDASVSEIMMAFYSGATLTIPNDTVIKDKEQFVLFLKETKSTVVTFPPSYLGLLSENDISDLKCIITAGEPAHPKKAREVVEKDVNYFNAYGPTECAVCVSSYQVFKEDEERTNIPIGKPIANLSTYVLDNDLIPVPIGVEGILYVSGIGLSRGYLNRSDLTKEKFISNPFKEGERMYDTGDIVKWLPDSNIEFVGRNDQQVKIRGYRIELGEVENSILQYSERLQQVVVASKEVKQEKVLVAYYVTSESVDKLELRRYLEESLPEYMVPSFYVNLEALPITPNGKVDKNALPEVEDNDIIRKEYVAPRNKIEEQLVEIWQEVLNVEKVGITDNFFELGGHSIKAIQLTNKVNTSLKLGVRFKDIFSFPTIEIFLVNKRNKPQITISKAIKRSDYPLTPQQYYLWLLCQNDDASKAYNVPVLCKLRGKFCKVSFIKSLEALLNRHENLRTIFVQKKGIPRQKILAISEFDESYFYYKESNTKKIEQEIQQQINQLFNLSTGPLFKAYLYKTNEKEHVLLINVHHIICDGWSINVIIRDLTSLYNGFLDKGSRSLPELDIQYKDYTIWRNNLNIEKEKEFWLQQFEEIPPVIDIGRDKPKGIIKSYTGDSYGFTFESSTKKSLNEFCSEQSVTNFIFLLAASFILLYKYSNQTDIVFVTGVSDRENQLLENQVGFYVNTIPIRARFLKNDNFLDFLKVMKKTILDSYTNQRYGLGQLTSDMEEIIVYGNDSIFNIGFTYQNIPFQSKLKMKDIDLQVLDFTSTSSKFDISFFFAEVSDQIQCKIEYNSDLFRKDTIVQLGDSLIKIVISLLNNYKVQIKNINLLDADEEHLIFNLINN